MLCKMMTAALVLVLAGAVYAVNKELERLENCGVSFILFYFLSVPEISVFAFRYVVITHCGSLTSA